MLKFPTVLTLIVVLTIMGVSGAWWLFYLTR